MKKKVKFDVWFLKDIKDILWDESIFDFLSSAKDKKHGDVLNFKGETFVVDTFNIRKSLIWGVPVKINDRHETFVFKIPIYVKSPEELMSLNKGVCYMSNLDKKLRQAYSVSGYYDMNDNVLQLEKIHPISD